MLGRSGSSVSGVLGSGALGFRASGVMDSKPSLGPLPRISSVRARICRGSGAKG